MRSLRILHFLFILFPITLCFGQSDPLSVKQFKLENGLTVYLNEDHSKQEIFGAVVVKAGSKNDPSDATGIAHYFEHIMFKGTDKIGTLNYAAEKVFLDSITVMYDSLAMVTDEALRSKIQMKINDLSIKASEYAIPNEVDVVLRDIGSSGLNAYTSLEQTVFHNSFPSNQLEKWMDIYVERFRSPVIRLFQSELETVYEEKNMYSDSPITLMFEDVLKTFFKHHPYGQQTTIGTAEHLKNPRLSKMLDFYNTYYVANNMALVLCGDFDSEAVIPLIESKFGTWRTGAVPEYPNYTEDPFSGREFKEVKLSPVRIGVLAYRTVPNNHPDETALKLCNAILANAATTGLLDKLVMDNKVMMASSMTMQGNDLGGTFILFVPKIVGQKFEEADALVLAQIDSLRQGKFSDGLLDAVKMEYRIDRERMLENTKNRAALLVDAFVKGITWDDILNEIHQIDNITRDDIIRVANQYFGANYLAYWSNMGFPKKDLIEKPDWKPVLPKNTEARSEFAKRLDEVPEIKMDPRFIDFNKDVSIVPIKQGDTLYHNNNPFNDVFSLTVCYRVGNLFEPRLDQATQFMNLIGTQNHTYQDFRFELQKLGSSCYFEVGENELLLYIDGLDRNLIPTLALVNELLLTPKSDEKQLEKFIEEAKMEFKFSKDDPETLGEALYYYALYREQSPYLRQLSLKEVEQLTGDTLLNVFKRATLYETQIYYTGKTPAEDVKAALLEQICQRENPTAAKYIELQPKAFAENTLYVSHNKKSIQSKIYFYTLGTQLNEYDKAIANGFNEYFGGSMSSLVFQEIREFRSLSYSAHADYMIPYYTKNPGELYGYLGTQSDKTIEGVQTMRDLFVNMPEKAERITGIRKALLQQAYTNQPDFRDLPATVAEYRNKGYRIDPNKYYNSVYQNIKFDDILNFYKNQVQGRALIITVMGNMKKVDADALKALGGNVVKVKQEQIIKE